MARYAPAGESDFDSDSDHYELYDDNEPSNRKTDVETCTQPERSTFGNQKPIPSSAPLGHGKDALGLHDLQNCIISGNLQVARRLIEELKNPDVILSSSWTCLMYASYFAQTDLMSFLLEKGADARIANMNGTTALHALCRSQVKSASLLEDALKCLLDAGADADACDHAGKTALMYASQGESQIIVGAMLDLECRDEFINLKDGKGWTALDWAAAYGRSDTVELLSANGALKSSFASDASLVESAGEAKSAPVPESEINKPMPAAAEGSVDSNDVEQQNVPALIVKEDLAVQEYALYGQLELFLLGLDLAELIPIFKDQDLTFDQVLCLTDEELVEIGITKLGQRKQILHAMHECHQKHSGTSLLPDYTATPLTFESMQTMLDGASEQVTYIASCLRYINRHVKTCPHILQSKEIADVPPIETYKQKLNDISGSLITLWKSLKTCNERVAEVVQENEHKDNGEPTRILPVSLDTNGGTDNHGGLVVISLLCLACVVHKAWKVAWHQ